MSIEKNPNPVTYHISSDARNWILVERQEINSGKNRGEFRETQIGFYATAASLIRDVHNKLILLEGVEHIEEAIAKANAVVEEAVAKIEAMVKPRI